MAEAPHYTPPAASLDPELILRARASAALARVFPELGPAPDAMVAASKQKQFGDLQCNAAMALAKERGLKPRDVAAKIVEHLASDELVRQMCEPLTPASIAGPGFINLKLRAQSLAASLVAMDTGDLGVVPGPEPATVVVDLCGVNLAKQMHVGHLRSTIIGDAIARVFQRLGDRVIRQSHVGDWGLPIAMVTAALRDGAASGTIDLQRLQLDQLDALYRSAQRACTADRAGLELAHRFNLGPKVLAELEAQVDSADERLADAKTTLLKLQSRDPATVAIWQRIYDITMNACIATCARLHAEVRAEHSAGESSYADELPQVVDDLIRRGVAEESDGALIVRVEGVKEPCLIRKSDGGFLYATTDLAAIRHRVQTLNAEHVIYCVDSRQSLHFRQVFGAAVRAGYADRPGRSDVASLEHAAFGNVLGEDNRPLKTRSGENVRLASLIEEAVERAERVVAEKSPELSPDERRRVAEAVGVTAIKYADLSNDRVRDYVFSFERMIAFEGDTGPYLLYALVRLKGIAREAREQGIAIDPAAAIDLGTPEERELALVLLRYGTVLDQVAEYLEPHRLCAYLYELAGAYSTFYRACHVLRAPTPELRQSRLRLCALTERVLRDGLNTLGLPTVERM